MRTANDALAQVAAGEDAPSGRAALFWDRIEPEFLAKIGWDDQRVVVLSQHPGVGYKICLVEGCDKATTTRDQLCIGCAHRWKDSGQPLEEFLAAGKRHWRSIGIVPCAVPECGRPSSGFRRRICGTHYYQQQRVFRLPLEEFLAHPEVKPLPSFGPCQVLACFRDAIGNDGYCNTHAVHLRTLRRQDPGFDEQTWRRTAPAVAQNGHVSLRGLADLVVAEILLGLQERIKAGSLTHDHVLRAVADRARLDAVASITELPVSDNKAFRALRNTFVKVAESVGLDPETERHKDVWNATPFGYSGTLTFTGISQPWLREATKRWAFEDLPRRRGKKGAKSVQDYINVMALLSESLRRQRPDSGQLVAQVGRTDVTSFLNRLAYLHDQGEMTAKGRLNTVYKTRSILARMRSMGLTRPDQPLHGLPDDFTVTSADIPDTPEDCEAGKDLPIEVMRTLCTSLPLLEDVTTTEGRVAVELIIDTGRRPDEICRLPLDCLDRDADGKPVLLFDNHKAYRLSRRLPIAEATAALIVTQQERVRSAFPATPPADLALLPSPKANRDGIKPITAPAVSDSHRRWVDGLPPILVATQVQAEGRAKTAMLPFDKSKIFLYAYRHTYAQRHADAGVAPDVLRDLMDHRLISTTQRYYRVGEERRREAVDRVVTMQFDRYGNRIWRQAKTLLDSEHSRRSVGEVAIPYGGCTEPSNVAAGGHSCPFRFRCIGCGHFRTDVSYLPDLETYLSDLLRSRERLLAAVEVEEWARAEAMPSDEEISRVRRLISRMKQDIDELDEEEKTQIMEAVSVVRKHRKSVVSLGMPQIRQPLPDVRPERVA